jgi:cytochrome c6
MSISLSISSLLVFLLPQLALAMPPVLPGQVLFQKNCVRCHGANGKRGAFGAHDLTKSNLNEFGRTYLVTNGMGKMPAFGKTLSPAQVQEVVAYSLTLK